MALYDYVAAHGECETDDDCRSMSSDCAFSRQHCSGAVAVGRGADPEEFAALDDALTACAAQNEGWSCATCDAAPPAPRCIEGRCSAAP